MTNALYKSLAAALAAGVIVVLTLLYSSRSESSNLSEQCVQKLASIMAKSEGASVRTSGDRLWIGGQEIRVHAEVENEEKDPAKGFFGVGLKVDVSVGGVPQPTLTSGVVGAANNKNDAVEEAVGSWAALVGYGLLKSLGVVKHEGKTISVPNYTVHTGYSIVRGTQDVVKSFPSDQDLINRLSPVIESLHSSPGEFHLISMTVAMNSHGLVRGEWQGECRVDGAISPEALKVVQSFPWPEGGYFVKQFFVLRRR
jgi:Family of unknown function (DUF6348)